MEPGQIVLAAGSIYGTYDAGRSWYKHSKQTYSLEKFFESPLEKAFYIHRNASGVVTAVLHTHVDDVLAAHDSRQGSPDG